MSELQSNTHEIEIPIHTIGIKNILSQKSKSANQTSTMTTSHDYLDKDISDIGKLTELCPISPAKAVQVQRNDVDLQCEDDVPKVILNLGTTSLPHYTVNVITENEEDKKIAKNQLKEISVNRGRRKKQQFPDSAITKNVKLISASLANNQMLEDNEENDEEEHYLILEDNGKPKLSVENFENNKNENVIIVPTVGKKVGRKRKADLTATLNSITSDWNDDNNSDEEKKKVVAQSNVAPIVITELNKPRRVIKKKIIWDPDAPETHFPLASLVHGSARQKQVEKAATSVRSEIPKKVDLKPSKSNLEQKSETVTTIVVTSSKPMVPKKEEVKILKELPKSKLEQKSEIVQKRRSETPVILNNKKKKLTESDKLLNDEGIVNMLNDLENASSKGTAKREVSPVKKEITKKVLSPPKKETTLAPTILKKQNSSPVLQNVKKGKVTPLPDDPNLKKESPLPKKRIPKPKQNTWDFVYNQKNIDAMIIRRRSSSYSSTTSPRRLSVEHIISPDSTHAKKGVGPNNKNKIKKENQTVQIKKSNVANTVGKNGNNFEFAKPQNKQQKNPINVVNVKRETTNVRESPRKSGRQSVTILKRDFSNLLPSSNSAANLEIKDHGSVKQLIFYTNLDGPKSSRFNAQMLKNITKNLETLSNDNSCKVLVITAKGSNFCQGIDFKAISNTNVEKRKAAILELTQSLKEFLHALANFHKPIIVGVHGNCFGLGVTMLPLFDVVVSSDKCTFEASYIARSEGMPEGYCILSLSNNIRHNFKTNLFWLNEKINSNEAVISGLVTKLTTSDKLEEDTLNFAKKISTFSTQACIAMKKLRFKHELSRILAAIDDENQTLIDHWSSNEFQDKIKMLIQKGQL